MTVNIRECTNLGNTILLDDPVVGNLGADPVCGPVLVAKLVASLVYPDNIATSLIRLDNEATRLIHANY